jgi:hypothetical protein
MAKRARKRAKVSAKIDSLKNKIRVSLRNLVVFLILFAASFILWMVSSTDIFRNLFGLLSIIFGFLSLALLIVLMVFLILKSGKK